MTKIKIKNFGPIKTGFQDNGGWVDINKVTIFIGNQGSGKSCIAKLISTFSWMEKVLTRGDYQIKDFTNYSRFRKLYCAYHRIENYFFDLKGNDIAEIEFVGKTYHFKYYRGSFSITEIGKDKPQLSQIMYVPAERNFIANVKTPKALKLTSDSLIDFVTEFDKAKDELKAPMRLPINNVDVEYDKLNDTVNIKGADYKVKLTEASSGFQSLVPLYIVSWYFANLIKKQSEIGKESMSSEEMERFKRGVADIWANENLTEEQRRAALSVLSAKFNKSAFVNIIEEPEQNLFPKSQKEMLKSLLKFNNMNEGNKLIMTTHSPYIINYMSLFVKANELKAIINTQELKDKLNSIIPLDSTISASDLRIYELDETKGVISILGNYKGLPSDENYLNGGLAESNEEFANLLDIEDLCQ